MSITKPNAKLNQIPKYTCQNFWV